MTCIACGSSAAPDRILDVPSDTDTSKYSVEICSCGLGTTKDVHARERNERANHAMYDSIEVRVDIYFRQINRHLQARFGEALKLLREKGNGGNRFLEVGSNIGFAANLAHKAGFDVTACELNERCREASRLIFGIDPEPDFFAVEGCFDFIVMCDVLEHFPDPFAALEKCRELLVPGGILFVQSPNLESREARLSGPQWRFFCVPDHLFHFTTASLSMLAAKAGLVSDWARTVGFLDERRWTKWLPQGIRRRFLNYANSSLLIGFIPENGQEGSLLQAILRKT